MLRFLLRMKQADGGFSMHEGGEVDVRGCYTAISVSSPHDPLVLRYSMEPSLLDFSNALGNLRLPVDFQIFACSYI